MDVININDYQNVSWIESLAMEEINMEESGIIRFSEHLSTNALLEESSIEFMNKIKDRFEFYVSMFNQHRSGRDNSRAIKVFRISNTVNDFILFRNSLKLIVARRAPDVVSIGFLNNSGGLFAPRMPNENISVQQIHEIKAHVGPFNNITWRFQGELVETESLVKYYLTEFIKNSSR